MGDGEDEAALECPVWLTHQLKEFFTAWGMREKGLLPRSGGWTEQPYYWIQALDIIGAAAARAEHERIENMKREREPD